jgi:phage repressor protein C with HTH and peptisase S24 domain
MSIHETRRRNLQALVDRDFEGNKSALANAIGRQASYISRCLSTDRHSKNIGEAFARHIETELGIEEGWLDRDHRGDYLSMTQPQPMVITEGDPGPLGSDEVELPYYREVELEGGCGRTEVIENHGASMRFSLAKLARAGVQPENAACATLVGNSMEPRIMDGSPIAIDTGATRIEDGRIYAIDHGGMLRVKYLYRLPLGRIRIASENSAEHPDEIVSPPDLEELRIIGRVFWWESFD